VAVQGLLLGTDAGRFERRSLLARRAVAAADRLLREMRGRGHGRGGSAGGDAPLSLTASRAGA
jgi:hypothetical protein